VHVVFPTAWDRKQLLRPGRSWNADYEVVFASPDDADCRDDFDVLGFIDDAIANWAGTTDGVMSSSDYPGATAAAAISTGLGLPGSRPADSMRAAHKGLARAVAQRVLPDATPSFVVLDPDRLGALPETLPMPAYVKPAKGAYSVLARRVEDREQLVAFLGETAVRDYREHYLAIYRRLVQRYLGGEVDGAEFVAESVLRGRLVTVEAFATGDGVTVLGVVDSLRHPVTGSFIGFEYPSLLPDAVQRRLEHATARLGEAFGLRWTMFNVELMWDPDADNIGIVELNARMCGQFADLYEKVDGIHGHRIALDLACGVVPQLKKRSGPCLVAASYPLRVFEPVRVEHAPSPAQLADALSGLPGALAWNEVSTGDVLDDFVAADDGKSYRYAVLNVGAGSRAALIAQRELFEGIAGYRFARIG
jgi:biotin carboxylase